MDCTLKRKKLLVLALAAAILGGAFAGTALAGTDTSSSLGQAFLDNLAAALGIDRTQLDQALQKAAGQTVDQAVEQGQLTPEQGSRIRARLEQGFPFGGRLWGGRRAGGGLCFAAAADALGLQPQELRAALQEGKTLEELAAAKGLTPEQLREQVLSNIKKELDQMVADKKLTQDQADQILQRVEERVKSDGWLQNCCRFPGFRGGWGARGNSFLTPGQTG